MRKEAKTLLYLGSSVTKLEAGVLILQGKILPCIVHYMILMFDEQHDYLD
jgi:hypothetical protein